MTRIFEKQKGVGEMEFKGLASKVEEFSKLSPEGKLVFYTISADKNSENPGENASNIYLARFGDGFWIAEKRIDETVATIIILNSSGQVTGFFDNADFLGLFGDREIKGINNKPFSINWANPPDKETYVQKRAAEIVDILVSRGVRAWRTGSKPTRPGRE